MKQKCCKLMWNMFYIEMEGWFHSYLGTQHSQIYLTDRHTEFVLFCVCIQHSHFIWLVSDSKVHLGFLVQYHICINSKATQKSSHPRVTGVYRLKCRLVQSCFVSHHGSAPTILSITKCLLHKSFCVPEPQY
jgi:hypothetical protein